MKKNKEEMNKVILYFALKYKGNWEKIYDAIKAKENVTIEQVETLKNKYNDNLITIIDESYLNNFKTIYMPPLCLFHVGNKDLLKNEKDIVSLWGDTSYQNWLEADLNKQKTYAIIYDNSMQDNVETLLQIGYKIILITNNYKNSDIGFLANYDNALFVTEIPFEVKKADIDLEQTNERLLLGISPISMMLGQKSLQYFQYLEPLFKFEGRPMIVTNLNDFSQNEIERFNIKLYSNVLN